MSISTDKNLYQRFKTWYRGQTGYSIGQQIGRYADNRTRSVKLPSIPAEFEPPLFARILNPIGRFVAKHFKWLITTSLIAIGLYLAYLQLIKPK